MAVLLALLPSLLAISSVPRLGGDIILQYYPSKFFLKQNLQSGVLPLWNPNTFLGAPFIANPQRSALFYPDWLWFFLPIPMAFAFSQVIHVFLAALGMWLLVRHYTKNPIASLVAALAFAFGGHIAHRVGAGHLPQIQSSIWLPWGLLCAEKMLTARRGGAGWGIATGATLALGVLAGFPEAAFMNGVAIGLRVVFALFEKVPAPERNRRIRLVAVMGVVALGLCAVQLLPTLELVLQSARVDVGYEALRARSFPPINTVVLFAPDFLGSPSLENAVLQSVSGEAATYVGIPTLLFAVCAIYLKRSRTTVYFSALAVLSFVLALGAYTPLYHFFYLLPGFKQVGAPYRYVLLLSFSLAALGGLAADALFDPETDRRRIRRVLTLTLLLTAGALLVTTGFWVLREPMLKIVRRLVIARYADPSRQLAKIDFLYRTQLHSLLHMSAIGLATGAILLAVGRRPRLARTGLVLLVALLALDLGLINFKNIQTAPFPMVKSEAYHAFLKQDSDIFRVLPLSSANAAPDASLVTGIPSATGYDPIMLRRYRKYALALEKTSDDMMDTRAPMLNNIDTPLIGQANVKYLLSRKPVGDGKIASVFRSADGVSVYPVTDFKPRVYVARRLIKAADPDAALNAVAKGLAADEAVVEEDVPAVTAPSGNAATTITKIDFVNPNRVRITGSVEGGGLLVLQDVNFPGWKARIDGKETPIHTANYLFRGVFVPSGNHVIEFSYEPVPFRVGAIVSAITALLVLITGVAFVARRSRETA